MKISFINPSMTGERTRGRFEPLTFAALAGATPAGVERVLFDECLRPIPVEEPTDLAAISVSTMTARRAYQLAAQYHRRGVPVVLGGYQPTLFPQEALRFADAIIIGEAERVWPRVVEDFRTGRPQRVYREPCLSLEGLRYDRTIFAGKRYQPIRLVQFGRGCLYDCDFCVIPRFFEKRWTHRPVGEVADEVGGLGRAHIFFVDDNLYAGHDAFRELLAALTPLRVRWTCQASLDIASDPELVRRMAQAGCFSVLIGFESLAQDTLTRMNKGWHRGRSQYEDAVRRLDGEGILVYGTFVLGYDEDSPGIIDACLEFAERSRLFLAAFNLLMPLPGTGVYQRLLDQGRLIGDPWWLDPATRFCKPVFEPLGMTSEELRQGAHRIRSRFYGLPGILTRALKTPSVRSSLWRFPLYLAANLVYRREVRRLDERPYGDPGDPNELVGFAADLRHPVPPGAE
jgi:radical SAM superfamily enzyme YgiQ (UPF0313 family)